MKNEVKPGYQLTEVGILPKDWSVEPLGKMLKDRPQYGINAPAVSYSDQLPTYIRITDISEDGRFSSSGRVSVNAPRSEQYYLSVGDTVFARTGASVGKSYSYKLEDGPLVYAGFLIKVCPDASKLLPEYLSAYVSASSYWRWVQLMSMRSGQPGINGNEYSQLPVPLPPALKEQQAIASVIADIDELIFSLDQLIAKKRDIKQATMQQLLTGKKRLPGFSGEWESVRAGDIGNFRGGNGFPLEYQGGAAGDYPFYKVSDMNNEGNETFMSDANNWITEATRVQVGAALFPAGSIVFAKVGAAIFLERKKILTVPSCIDNNMAALTLDKSRADFRFIHWALLNMKFGAFVSTTALPSLSGAVLSQISLPLPSLPEQSAIATVLEEMNAELSAQERRLKKLRTLKQGMMQELLTGRIRLV